MNILKFSKNKINLYTKILAAILISVILTVLLQSTILNIYYENNTVSMTYNFMEDSLTQISTSAEIVTTLVKNNATQMYLGNDFNDLFISKDIPDVTLINLNKKLVSYIQNNPYIHSIYFYNKEANRFYTNFENYSVVNTTSFFDYIIS